MLLILQCKRNTITFQFVGVLRRIEVVYLSYTLHSSVPNQPINPDLCKTSANPKTSKWSVGQSGRNLEDGLFVVGKMGVWSFLNRVLV
jgi:hypothetical protein